MSETRDPKAPAAIAGAAPATLVPDPGSPAKSDQMIKKLAEVLAQAAPAEQPAQATSETQPGGRFLRNARLQGNKQMGGQIVDAHGNVLATFEDTQENTGRVEDGKKPEKPGA